MGSNDNEIEFVSGVQPLANHVLSFRDIGDWVGALCLIPGQQMFTLLVDSAAGGAVAPDTLQVDVCLTVATLSRARNAFP
jgi:hypothetical protein